MTKQCDYIERRPHKSVKKQNNKECWNCKYFKLEKEYLKNTWEPIERCTYDKYTQMCQLNGMTHFISYVGCNKFEKLKNSMRET